MSTNSDNPKPAFKHLDLCSGIGGFALGFEWAGLSRPIMFCDTDPWCRKVLNKHWPDVPVAHDVKELANDPATLVPDFDILTAGYPCQPFSQAGKRKGEHDERHIWPFINKIIGKTKPRWCVFENVRGHISIGLDRVINELQEKNYTVIPMLLPAYCVGAIHERARVYIVSYANDRRSNVRRDGKLPKNEEIAGDGNLHRRRTAQFDTRQWREIKSKPYGVANGIPNRLDRIRGIGNAIVPQIAMCIGLTIKQIEQENG
jgi:DNA (cytosine-5)-methyltransferase 1